MLTADAQYLSRAQSCVVGCALLECLVYVVDMPRDIVSVSLGVRHAFRVFGAKEVRGLAEVLHVVSRLKRRRGPELREWEMMVLHAAQITLSAIVRGSVGERERAVSIDLEVIRSECHTSDIRSELAAGERIGESVRRWLLEEVWVK